MPFLSALPTVDPQSVADGSSLWSSKGYIDGLKMKWVSATALTISSGRAYIPSLGYCVELAADFALTGLALTASTFYHVYLDIGSGTGNITLSTTVPAASYYGTARTMTGDTSKRYVGSVLSDATGNLINFDHAAQENTVHYKSNINSNGMHPLTSGGSLTQVNVSLSAVIPTTGTRVFMYLENSGNDIAYVGVPSLALVANVFTFVRPSSRLSSQYIMESQQISYQMGAANTSGGLDAWVQGYIYER